MTSPMLILTPTRREAAGVRAAVAGRSGQNRPVVVETIGVGGCRTVAGDLIKSAHLVVLAGVGGSLDPDCRPGDVLIDSGLTGIPQGTWRPGRIHTSDRIVATPDDKRRLREATGCHAVDMEQSVVRSWLPEHKPLCSIRAILDGADESLSPSLAGVVDDLGRTRIGPLVRAVVRRDLSLTTLWWLARRSRIALARLGEVVALVVDWADTQTAFEMESKACLST